MALGNILNATYLIEKELVDPNGWLIGRVSDLIFDEKSWSVRSLVAELEGNVAKEFNMKKTLRKTHVMVDVSYVQGIGDKVALRYPKEQLMGLIRSSSSVK